MKTREQWVKLAKGYAPTNPDISGEIADYCLANPAAGVWHAQATLRGTRCFCAACAPDLSMRGRTR